MNEKEKNMINETPIHLINLPDVLQSNDYGCGVYAAQAIMAYYGEDWWEQELEKELHVDPEFGTPIKELIKFFKANHLKVYAGKFTIDKLKATLDSDIPVILLIQAWDSDSKKDLWMNEEYGHYCFTPDTKILTKTGYKQISNINIGEFVLTHKGNFKKVLKKTERKYNGEILKIKTNGSINEIKTTPEHPFYSKIYKSKKTQLLKQKNFLHNINFIKAKEITKQHIVLNKCITEEIDIIDINHNRAFLLGAYIGNGNITGDKRKDGSIDYNKIRFIVGTKETFLIEKIKLLMKTEFDLETYYSYPKNNNCVHLIYYSSEVVKYFEKYGGKPQHKQIKDEIYFAKKDILYQFINGWFETDGCQVLDKKNLKNNITTTEETLAYGLKIILDKLNISYSVFVRKGGIKQVVKNCYDCKDAYMFNWMLNSNKYHSIYNNNYKINRITKKDSEIYNGLVYNLEVEDDNSYIAEDFIVHNCIAIGYTDTAIIFEDPAIFGRGYINFSELEKRWHGEDEKILRNFGIAVWGKKPFNFTDEFIHID
jgi:intein/homing endonuclease